MLITDRHHLKAVPYVHQFGEALLGADGDPQLIAKSDGRWRTSGALTYDEYVLWARNGCGTACFRMVLLHQFGRAPSFVQLANWLTNAGAYQMTDDGVFGMIYQPFVDFVQRNLGFGGQVLRPLSIRRLTYELSMGHYPFISVHQSIRDPRSEPPRRGGHLVLVTGFDDARQELLIHDPSGLQANRQDYARVAYRDVERFSANRGLTIWNPNVEREHDSNIGFGDRFDMAMQLPDRVHRGRSLLALFAAATDEDLAMFRFDLTWGRFRMDLARLRIELAREGSDFDESVAEALSRPRPLQPQPRRDGLERSIER